MSYRIVLIIGSVREQRQGTKVARFLEKKISERGWTLDVVDPKETPLPMLNMRYKDYEPGTAPRLIQDLHDRFTAADGFVLVSPEYNRSVPPALKNVLDHFGPVEFGHKPVAIATYSDGRFGGVRAMEHLKLICIDLGMTPIKVGFSVGEVDVVFPADAEPAAGSVDALRKQTEKFLDDFSWYLPVLKHGRASQKTA